MAGQAEERKRTVYIVLRRMNAEAWYVLPETVEARDGDEACRLAASKDGESWEPGSYWAVPARTAETNRLDVDVEMREVPTFTRPNGQTALAALERLNEPAAA